MGKKNVYAIKKIYIDSLNPRVGFVGAQCIKLDTKNRREDGIIYLEKEQLAYYGSQGKLAGPNGNELKGVIRAHGKLVGYDIEYSKLGINIYDISGIFPNQVDSNTLGLLELKGRALTKYGIPVKVKASKTISEVKDKSYSVKENIFACILERETNAEFVLEGMFISKGNVLTNIIPFEKAKDIYLKALNERKGKIESSRYNHITDKLKKAGLFDKDFDARVAKKKAEEAKQKAARQVAAKQLETSRTNIARPNVACENHKWVLTDKYMLINVKNNRPYYAIYKFRDLQDGTIRSIDGTYQAKMFSDKVDVINIQFIDRTDKNRATGQKIGTAKYQVYEIPKYKHQYPVAVHSPEETVRLGLGTKHTQKILDKKNKVD